MLGPWEPACLNLFLVLGYGIADHRDQVDVLFHKLGLESVEKPHKVMIYQHLAVAVPAGADPDARSPASTNRRVISGQDELRRRELLLRSSSFFAISQKCEMNRRAFCGP